MRDWMADARKAKGMTLAKAAEKLDITESYLLLIEQGKRMKTLDLTMVQKLGELYGLTAQEIIDKENA